jgi:hypothetical protein
MNQIEELTKQIASMYPHIPGLSRKKQSAIWKEQDRLIDLRDRLLMKGKEKS